MGKRKSILIIQPILAHYRNSLFQILVNSDEFDIRVLAGKQIGNIKEISSQSDRISASLTNRMLNLGKHTFIWQAGIVRYVFKQRPDMIVLTGVDPHIVSNLFISFFSKGFLNTKIIWWGHASVGSRGKGGRLFRRFFFNLANGVFTYSNEGKKNLETLIRSDIRISVIKNSINNQEYGFSHPMNNRFKDKVLTILFSGRLTMEKRIDILIDSIAILKSKSIQVSCLIIGEGPQKKIVEEMVVKNQLSEAVTFLGEKYQDEIVPYFEDADIFVLPGKVGLSIIHGLSYGLPVITSDQKDIHSPEFEILSPGYNGDFFVGFDPSSLAEKIIYWGNKIRSNKKQIADRCISSVKEMGYTPEIMSEKMIDLFRNLGCEC